MKEIITSLLMVIILLGAILWVFNNPNGVNKGIENGGNTVYTKISKFDYSGTVAPGTGHNSELPTNPNP